MTRERRDHVCAKHAICFECFKAGLDGARERRNAWAQRALPFEPSATPSLTPRALAHRRQMLEHLSRSAVASAVNTVACSGTSVASLGNDVASAFRRKNR
jgi:hypothetical protein